MPRYEPRGADDPIERARLKATEVREALLQEGRRVVRKNEWARDLFPQVQAAAPSVPDEELYRIFARRPSGQPELILGQALFLEYNATHPRPSGNPAPREDARPGRPAKGDARKASA